MKPARVTTSTLRTSAIWKRTHTLVLALGVAISVPSLAALAQSKSAALPPPVITSVLTKALADYPGKEALIITVEYPPGGGDPIHRHDAHGFVYVLEGQIVMGVKGGKEVTLGPGEAWYEGPNDIHSVGRNASREKPAKFLVVLLKNQGAEALLPVK